MIKLVYLGSFMLFYIDQLQLALKHFYSSKLSYLLGAYASNLSATR